jgi:uncharacterized protein (TIGR02271 family)
MAQDEGTMATPMTNAFREGATVFDAGGETVGNVGEYNAQGNYLLVRKGWLFGEDAYIPTDAVNNIGANGGIYLKLYKDDLLKGTWDTPPSGTGMATMAGTAGSGTTDMTATGGMTTGTAETVVGAQDTTDVAMAGTTDIAAEATSAEDVRVPVMEEELVVGKRAEEVGRVHLHKEVVQEQETIPVTLQREEVVVERVPVSGQADVDTTDAFVEQDIDVPVMGEEAVVAKRAVETEEVRLRKQATTEQQEVSDTVRKERVVVDGAEDVVTDDADVVQSTRMEGDQA